MSEQEAALARLREGVEDCARTESVGTMFKAVDVACALAQISTLQASLAAAEGKRDALAARLAEGERLLKPFAAVSDPMPGQEPHQEVICRDGIRRTITMAHFRAARSFLTPTGEGK